MLLMFLNSLTWILLENIDIKLTLPL